MASRFPDPIHRLPRADIPLAGVTAFLSQSGDHQILFMEFEEEVVIPAHAHAAQVGFVLNGKIEITINGCKQIFERGDMYYIPSGVSHSTRVFAGYADITFFEDPNRYPEKKAPY